MTTAMAIISMLSSKVALLAFGIVIAKCVTKRIKSKNFDRFFMKIHRSAGYTLVATGFIHGIQSFSAFNTTPVVVYIFGFICLLAIIVAIATFICRKALGKMWGHYHRFATIIALVALVLHLLLRH